MEAFDPKELTLMVFNTGLTHLGSEASKYGEIVRICAPSSWRFLFLFRVNFLLSTKYLIHLTYKLFFFKITDNKFINYYCCFIIFFQHSHCSHSLAYNQWCCSKVYWRYCRNYRWNNERSSKRIRRKCKFIFIFIFYLYRAMNIRVVRILTFLYCIINC